MRLYLSSEGHATAVSVVREILAYTKAKRSTQQARATAMNMSRLVLKKMDEEAEMKNENGSAKRPGVKQNSTTIGPTAPRARARHILCK
jgi:hypothetical protein